MAINKLINKLAQPFWRMTRGLTLGVQAVVIGADGRILLVRHTYRPGWHFPGGGVKWNETLLSALARELREETGVIAKAPPELHGIYSNYKKFPGDHIALFIIRDWVQPEILQKNMEIAEQGFFELANLPDDTVASARRRLDEIFNGLPAGEIW